jgi:hypothetical protein
MVMLWLGSTGVSSPPLGSLTVHEDPCRGAAARWVGQIPDQRIRKYVQKKRLKALMQETVIRWTTLAKRCKKRCGASRAHKHERIAREYLHAHPDEVGDHEDRIRLWAVWIHL